MQDQYNIKSNIVILSVENKLDSFYLLTNNSHITTIVYISLDSDTILIKKDR